MKNDKIDQLQKELKMLELSHAAKEVTVKIWNKERAELDQKIRDEENGMLAIRVRAWRAYRDLGEQLDLF